MSPYITLIVRKPFSTNCWVKPPYMVQEIMRGCKTTRLTANVTTFLAHLLMTSSQIVPIANWTSFCINWCTSSQLRWMASASSLDACSWTCQTCHSLVVQEGIHERRFQFSRQFKRVLCLFCGVKLPFTWLCLADGPNFVSMIALAPLL